LAFIEKEL
jgi:hypothetical protein